MEDTGGLQHHPGGWKKYAPYAIAGIALLLVMRARSGGAAATEKSATQSVAEQLQLKQLVENFNYNKALHDADLAVKQAQTQLNLDILGHEHRLYTNTRNDSDAAWQCPEGKERIDPVTGIPYCRKKVGGGITLTTVGNAILNARGG